MDIHSLLYQAPLAEQMRPHKLENYIGQEHLNDKLAALSNAKRLPSLLLYGPPGCGKSTLALLLAKKHNLPFIRISAPEAGITELRKKLKDGQCLILDELHRFSKAQQDFFLPLLENGNITLIATTTENPSFCITRQLLSRLHLLKLEPLADDELLILAKNSLTSLNSSLDNDVINLLVHISYGDARTLLNLIELTTNLPKEEQHIEAVQKALPEIVAKHDKNGDSHYEKISALIKSIRGSDPDAALYYLASLLAGGEDVRFIARRLIISASEDIGLADPQALPLAVACQQAVEFIGMPEGSIPLAETTVYLALAPKSNSTYAAYNKVAEEIKSNGISPVPIHLRNAHTNLQRNLNYGRDYKYPHDYENAFVNQRYLPDNIDKTFYKAKEMGREAEIYKDFLKRINKEK